MGYKYSSEEIRTSVLVICISFAMNAMVMGIAYALPGIVFVELLDAFPDSSSGTISAAMSLLAATAWGVGPLASLLTNCYGAQKVAMLGGLVGSLGLILSMFATNIYHLYVTFGFLTGFGFGIAYIPAINIVGLYFDKRRTIALGLAVSGCGIGSFLFPVIMQFLIHLYYWRGALLITGGICLNMCVCGALISPSITKIRTKQPNQNCPQESIETASKLKSSNKSLTNHLNLHILSNKSYLFLCANNFFLLFGQSIIYVHFSAYSSSLGHSHDQGAWLFSAMGIANFVGRIAFGFIANIRCISAISAYTVALFITGAVTEFCPYFTSYVALVVYVVLFGFMSASLGTLLPQILVDILGVDMMTSGYGYVLLFEALGTLMGAPVAGWIYDCTKIYQTSLYLGGGVIMISSLIMMYPWFCIPARQAVASDVIEVKVHEDKSPYEKDTPVERMPLRNGEHL